MSENCISLQFHGPGVRTIQSLFFRDIFIDPIRDFYVSIFDHPSFCLFLSFFTSMFLMILLMTVTMRGWSRPVISCWRVIFLILGQQFVTYLDLHVQLFLDLFKVSFLVSFEVYIEVWHMLSHTICVVFFDFLFI